jgi:hypothetical protein
MKTSMTYFVIWLAGGVIAAFMALQLDSAAFVDGHYIPVGNDSFYHARRILDAAIGDRGFYQFDNMIHVPEGSWLNWPWGYDYLMACALTLAMWMRPSIEPMSFLAHVPVSWVFVNMALLTMIGREIRLGAAMTAIGVLCFALLPLTQTLHGIGIIDHHYIELTFVLATVWSGLRFFSEAARTIDAVTLGVVLGVAPAFHNGLFILQIPVLACLLILWSRRMTPHTGNLLWFAGTLIAATLLAVLPSTPFRHMQFEFWTLSWFHLYVAICSAICAVFLGWRTFSRLNTGLLMLIATALVVPVFAKLLTGTAFLTGDLTVLENITEVKSPLARLREPGGIFWVTTYYSRLIFPAPLLVIPFAFRAWRHPGSANAYFSIFVVFGISLMLAQYRLHPFGVWAVLFGSLLLIDEWRARQRLSQLATSAVTLLVLAIAFQPPLRNGLFYNHQPGFTRDYAVTRTLFPSLATACAERSGATLSYTDDGHYIRYHTDCSVITNNFLLTPFHEKKVLEADALLQLTPEQLLKAAPYVRYVFVRMYETYEPGPNGMRPTPIPEVAARNAPLFAALTFSRELPDGYRLIDEVRVQDDRDFALASVFQIDRDKQTRSE